MASGGMSLFEQLLARNQTPAAHAPVNPAPEALALVVRPAAWPPALLSRAAPDLVVLEASESDGEPPPKRLRNVENLQLHAPEQEQRGAGAAQRSGNLVRRLPRPSKNRVLTRRRYRRASPGTRL